MWGIVPDANCEGHFRVLPRLLHTEVRRELWHSLNLAVLSFDELELPANATDRQVWVRCQQQVALITANRTADDVDLLESVIRALNTAQSLHEAAQRWDGFPVHPQPPPGQTGLPGATAQPEPGVETRGGDQEADAPAEAGADRCRLN